MSGNFAMPTPSDQIAGDAINTSSNSARSAHCKLMDVQGPGLYSSNNSSNMHTQTQQHVHPAHLKTHLLTLSKENTTMHPKELDLKRLDHTEKCDRSMVVTSNDSTIGGGGPESGHVENGYHVPKDIDIVSECAGHSVLQKCSLTEEETVTAGMKSRSLEENSFSQNSHNPPHTLSATDGSQVTSNASDKVAEVCCDKKDNPDIDLLKTTVPMDDSGLKVSDLVDQDSNEDSGVCSGSSCHCSGKDDKDCFNESKELVHANPHAENNANSSSSDVEFLLNKLEKTALDENVQTCANDVINGISYVVYESEKQMPDIMRLITKDLSEPYSIYTYRYFIHNWPKLCFLAMADNKCVGAIVCKLDLHKKMVLRGYIAMLAVDSEYRRRQIGSSLVTKAIQAMIRDDCDEVVLETEITNRAALQLYENLGFVRDKRLFRYYLNGVDALRLKLWLR